MDLFNFKVISLPPLVSKIFKKNVYDQTKDSLPEKITFYINVSLVLELIIQQMSQSSLIRQKKILSYIYICLLPLEDSLQLKTLQKFFTETSVVKMKLIQFSIAHACVL